MKKKVLVIAAHPDDEILGCGGSIARHVSDGDTVYSIIACEGESLRYKNTNVNQKIYIENARKILGVEKNFLLEFPDQKLDTYSLIDIIKPLESIIQLYKPNIIYCQHGGDINKDHQILFDAAMVALRPVHDYIEEIRTFYTVGSTELGNPMNFIPNLWVNIDKFIHTKIEAFSQYLSEIKEYPHPRSLKGLEILSQYTGNQVVMNNAESFMIIRSIQR
jgi:LmbE family N-acetylglucosaminyl deacetylase